MTQHRAKSRPRAASAGVQQGCTPGVGCFVLLTPVLGLRVPSDAEKAAQQGQSAGVSNLSTAAQEHAG